MANLKHVSDRLLEGSDPDSVDPYIYLSQHMSSWVLTIPEPQFLPGHPPRVFYWAKGGPWTMDIKAALVFSSYAEAEAYRDKFIGKGEPHGVPSPLGPEQKRLGESNDPDDVDPMAYILNVRYVIKDAHRQMYARLSKGAIPAVGTGGPGWTWVSDVKQATTIPADQIAAWMRHFRLFYGSSVPTESVLVSESADPDDVDLKAYVNDLEWAEQVLSDFGAVKVGDGQWVKELSINDRIRIIQTATGKFKVMSVNVAFPKHAVEREVPAYQLRAALEWASPRFSKWLRSSSVSSQVEESVDPDDVDPSDYIDGMLQQAEDDRAKLKRMLQRAYRNSFQQPEWMETDYREVETNLGSYVIPSDVCDSNDPDDFQDFVEGRIRELGERQHGWVYRTSAGGYMDASEWSAAETEEDALYSLIDLAEESGENEDGDLNEAVDPDDPAEFISRAPMLPQQVNELFKHTKTTFHCGFRIYVTDPEVIVINAQERGVDLKGADGDKLWNALNSGISTLEANALKWLRSRVSHPSSVADEGHDGDGDLAGSVYLDLAKPEDFKLVAELSNREEGWSTGNSTLDRVVYEGAGELTESLVDVTINITYASDCLAVYSALEEKGVTYDLVQSAYNELKKRRFESKTEQIEHADVEPKMRLLKLTVESKLNQLFRPGKPCIQEDTSAATEWSGVYESGNCKVQLDYSVFYKGENRPSALCTWKITEGGIEVYQDSEVSHGAKRIIGQLDLIEHAVDKLRAGSEMPRRHLLNLLHHFSTGLRR